MLRLVSNSCLVLVLQDGILFGMVGAYDWDGGVLKEGLNGRIMPPREAFESEFPLELKNHAAYLGDCNQNPRETKMFVGFTHCLESVEQILVLL